MGSLLSAISGQFAKVITLGTFFPVLIVSILNVIFVTPLLSDAALLQIQLKKIAVGDDKWGAVALTFAVVVLTGILYNLNIPLIRLYEGYPWSDSWVGGLFIRGKKKRLLESRKLRLTLRHLRRYLLRLSPTDKYIPELGAQQTSLALILNTELPSQERHLLPTRLGNVIRCFEMYSSAAYGIDAIVLWPRLISKIDAPFASTIDEAKASFDFMLNCSFLCLITAFGIVTLGLSRPTVLTWQNQAPWIWRAVFFGLMAFTFYYFSIGRAKAWGEQVKSAFDLYRLSLLEVLGYKQQPLSFVEEVTLWTKISNQLLYPDSRELPLPYKETTRVITLPPGIQLEIIRGYGRMVEQVRIPVTIQIKNTDPDQRQAVVAKIIETLPDGFKYVPDTARVSNGGLRVSSMTPLEFAIDPIAVNAKIVLTYEIKSSA